MQALRKNYGILSSGERGLLSYTGREAQKHGKANEGESGLALRPFGQVHTPIHSTTQPPDENHISTGWCWGERGSWINDYNSCQESGPSGALG